MSFAGILYVVLGIASFALIAFFAWATWSGGKTGKADPDAGPPSTTSREPIPGVTPPEEVAPPGRAGRV
ncbi:hypothetical protein [Rubrivirga sp.]|uniref:hypothetical protein n=1 Tax=Rubrivirga sp. TaxID=1885344 RepID=UPI003C72CE34